MKKRFDSIIFDMDGTLWDAVDSYAVVWNTTFENLGFDRRVTRSDLLTLMGKPLDVIIAKVCHPISETDKQLLLNAILESEGRMTRLLGGKLYPGVREEIPLLAKDFKLFMVSNCGPDGLHNFLEFTKLGEYFTDTLSHGQTLLPKEGNISRLIERYSLKASIYVGDVQSDADSAHNAGIPIAFAAYGFGKVSDAEFTIGDFPALRSHVMYEP